MEGSLRELLDLLKELSPEVWDILIKQAYVEVFSKGLYGVLFAIGAYVIKLKLNLLDTDLKWVAIGVSGLFGIISFSFFLSALKWLAHPEFYALRYLLWQIN